MTTDIDIHTPGADLVQEIAALATNSFEPDDITTTDGELVARTYVEHRRGVRVGLQLVAVRDELEPPLAIDQADRGGELHPGVRLQRLSHLKETTQARAGQKGELEIPAKLGLGLRVFIGGQPIGVSARFRYRVNDGALALGVVLDQVDTIVEAAHELVAEEIRDGIDRGRVLRGTPA